MIITPIPITHFPVSLFMLQNYKEEISSERIPNAKIINDIVPSPGLIKKILFDPPPMDFAPTVFLTEKRYQAG